MLAGGAHCKDWLVDGLAWLAGLHTIQHRHYPNRLEECVVPVCKCEDCDVAQPSTSTTTRSKQFSFVAKASVLVTIFLWDRFPPSTSWPHKPCHWTGRLGSRRFLRQRREHLAGPMACEVAIDNLPVAFLSFLFVPRRNCSVFGQSKDHQDVKVLFRVKYIWQTT